MPRHACLLIKNAFKNIRLWMLALGCLCPAAAHAAEVVIGGAGAAIGTLQALGAEFSKARANVHINVLPSLGSGGGIKALVAGKLTLAVTARPLTEAERRGGLVEHEIARTPLVIAVSNKSAVSKLSLDELAALYAGRTARWPDGTPVRPVLRPAEDTDTVVLKTFSPAVAQASQAALAREGMLIAITD